MDGRDDPAADCTLDGPAAGLYAFLWNRCDAARAGLAITGRPDVLAAGPQRPRPLVAAASSGRPRPVTTATGAVPGTTPATLAAVLSPAPGDVSAAPSACADRGANDPKGPR